MTFHGMDEFIFHDPTGRRAKRANLAWD